MKASTEVLQFLLICFSIGSTVIACLSWYSASVQKRYAAQRDFEHLKNNYLQLSSNQNHMMDEFDKRFDSLAIDVHDIKSALQLLVIKAQGENTTGWHRREQENK